MSWLPKREKLDPVQAAAVRAELFLSFGGVYIATRSQNRSYDNDRLRAADVEGLHDAVVERPRAEPHVDRLVVTRQGELVGERVELEMFRFHGFTLLPFR